MASGPTNSMRGAAFLTGLTDAAVIDIGGTTTDVGMLVGSFPRSRSEGATIGGVLTNFRVPDVYSFGLGGGSIVRPGADMTIGPDSVGFRLPEKALCFGGDTLTATDVAVAAGLVDLGDRSRLGHVTPDLARAALAQMKASIETVPVSYTHLDVYKRQTVRSTSCWPISVSPFGIPPRLILKLIWQL